METFSALVALCAGHSPVTSEFPSQRPVMWNFDVFFDPCLNKQLSKQSWGWWFETSSRSLWRCCYDQCVEIHWAKSKMLPLIIFLMKKHRMLYLSIIAHIVRTLSCFCCGNWLKKLLGLYSLRSEWAIKFSSLSGDSGQQGPYSPYKLRNHSLYIGIH